MIPSRAVVAAVAAAAILAGSGGAEGPKFYPDDPIVRDAERRSRPPISRPPTARVGS